jgi:hypothetical protein
VSLASANKFWQWFLHRRLATPDEVHSIQETYGWDHAELLKQVVAAFTGMDESG